jgi:hypothetical protein
MRISVMNDAADKIISIFKLYIAQKKWNEFRSEKRDSSSKGSLTGLRFLPNSTGQSYRSYGSNDTYSSNTSKSTLSGTAAGRKRSEGSLLGTNSLGEKKPQSSTRSSKYFTAKHLKGLASKLLYGKPKSPVELRDLLTKEASKLQTRISMELNASDFSDKEFVNSMNMNVGVKGGRSRKNSIAGLRSSGGSSIGPVRSSLKFEKSSRALSPALAEGETPVEIKKRKDSDASASSVKVVSKVEERQSRGNERSVSTSAIQSEREKERIRSIDTSLHGTSISSSSFFSVHENKQKINEELKDRQKRDYKEIKILLRDRVLKAKEKSFVLVTQKAYCLICSEEKHSSLFQVYLGLCSSLILLCVCCHLIYLCRLFGLLIYLSVFFDRPTVKHCICQCCMDSINCCVLLSRRFLTSLLCTTHFNSFVDSNHNPTVISISPNHYQRCPADS